MQVNLKLMIVVSVLTGYVAAAVPLAQQFPDWAGLIGAFAAFCVPVANKLEAAFKKPEKLEPPAQ